MKRIKKITIIVALGLFVILIAKAYLFQTKSISYEDLPIIKKNYTSFRKKFHENDGKIFQNQDRAIYNDLINSDEQKLDDIKIKKELKPKEVKKAIKELKNTPPKKSPPKSTSIFSVTQ